MHNIINELVAVNVTSRNQTHYHDLNIFENGFYYLMTHTMFAYEIKYNYRSICSDCDNEFMVNWHQYMLTVGDNYIKLCGKCRSKLAADKMIKTTQSDKHRNKMKFIIRGSLNDPLVKLARNKGSEKRKNGWCKTDHAKLVSVSNLKRFSGENHHNWNPNKNEFQLYKNKVLKYQSTWDLNLVPDYDETKRFLCGVEGGFQLDHIISQKYGYDNDIHPYYIAHICNLQFITWEENRYKHHNNSQQEVEDTITSINKIDQCVSFDDK